jgi:hypothetical protein
MEDIKSKIIEKFKNLPDHPILLATSTTTGFSDLNIALMDYLINEKKMTGVYVTVGKPYKAMEESLKKNNIDPKKLFFIDAISGTIGENPSSDNCRAVQNPSALTDISICVSETCNEKKPGFLIFDSLSTMIIYNNEAASVRFIHFLITNLRKLGVGGVIFSLEKDLEKKTLDNIAMFCDKVIKA